MLSEHLGKGANDGCIQRGRVVMVGERLRIF